ncbi:MAG: chorismate synthase [Clostridiales bacterium]|nr:chorismate synthase [Clostridiales bacterium]
MNGNCIGEKLKVHVFGASHGPAIGAVIEGFPAGMKIDEAALSSLMARRAPGQNAWSTQRKEADAPQILSGVDENGVTNGDAIRMEIANTNTRSTDYPDLHALPRPGHADFAANLKYGDAWDHRGGGPFSGRLTAPLCFAGALCLQYLKAHNGIEIAAHIARIGTIADVLPNVVHPSLPLYAPGSFPVICQDAGEKMKAAIDAARKAGDSVDGAIRCIVHHLPGGLGGPMFQGVEGRLAMALFGIPAVKGITFGETQMHGSENNDPFRIENGKITTVTNHHGGILGGITSGMPLYFTLSMKPTPSIALPQTSVNMKEMREETLCIRGRHDPCVVPRAVPVVEAVTAIALMDMILEGV